MKEGKNLFSLNLYQKKVVIINMRREKKNYL